MLHMPVPVPSPEVPLFKAINNSALWIVNNALWAGLILVVLFLIFLSHRMLMTRYGTDPRWKATSQLDQILDFEKQEHPTLEEDDHLPSSHWDI